MLQDWQRSRATLCPWQLIKTTSGRLLTSFCAPGYFPTRLQQVLWNLLPVSRKEKERKSPNKRREPCGQQLADKKAMAKSSPVLVAPLLSGAAPGRHHSHPQLQEQGSLPWGCSFQPCFPQAGFGGAGGAGILSPTIATPQTPQQAPSLPLPMGAWHFPSSQATPQLFTRHCHAHGKRCWRETSRLQPCHPAFPQALFSLFPFGPEWNSPPPLF